MVPRMTATSNISTIQSTSAGQLLHQQQYAHTNGADTSYVIPHLEGKSVDYLELVDSAPPVGDVSLTLDDSEKIKVSTIL